MGFKRPFDEEAFQESPFKHTRQLDFGANMGFKRPFDEEAFQESQFKHARQFDFGANMGFKQPFDEEVFQESPFKHTRQLEYGLKLISFTDIFPFHEAPQKTDIPVEGEECYYKFGFCEELENDCVNVVPDIADAEFEISDPFSWISTGEENGGSGAAVCSALSPEYFESNFSRRSLVQYKDIHSSLLDCSPRRQVPLGPNHQAEVPVWDLQVTKKHSLVSDHIVDDDCGKNLMGACVIPFPDLKLHAHGGLEAGDGRTDCSCQDTGSVRCIRQHVMEARERIRETLGHDKFVELGFYDMGEEVAQTWTEEEEQVFHEVVYSNPFSVGRNFWKHLFVMFPSRTKKELVSYYFNVFMLGKRAAQNRSSIMDIDSDDDEWQGTKERLVGVPGTYEDVRLDDDDDSLDNDHHNHDGTGNNGNDCGGDGDGDVRDDGEKTTEQDSGRSHMLKAQSCRTLDGCRFDFSVHQMDRISGCVRDDFNVQHVSCASFECQPGMVNSCCSVDTDGAIQERGVNSDYKKCLCGNGD